MNKASAVSLILFLICGVNTCGRSTNESKVESKAKEEINSLEKGATSELKGLEKDYKTLEGESDYKKALEKEPEAPPDAVKEPMGGEGFGEREVLPPG